MKILLCLLSILLSMSLLQAQQIRGKILLGLSETEGLSGVQVYAEGFSTQTSDELGRFSLPLPGKQAGDMVSLSIQKAGYAVINRENLRPRIPRVPRQRIALYLCPKGQRSTLALQHYKISVDRNIQVSFEEEVEPLIEEEKVKEIADLYERKESAEAMSDSLAARLARFDPGQASPELTQAMQLYQEGNIHQALEVLNPEELIGRIKEQQSAIGKLRVSIRLDIQSLMKAGDISLSNLQVEQAREYYEAGVKADTTDFEHLHILCSFLFTQNLSDDLIPYARMMIRQAKGDQANLSLGLNYLGIGLHGQNQYQEAIVAYQDAIAIRRKLASENLQNFTSYLSLTLNNLGATYFRSQLYTESSQTYEEVVKIRRQLLKDYGQVYAPDLASSLSNLGICYQALRRYDASLESFKEALDIQRDLVRDRPQHYSQALVKTLNNLGIVYRVLHQAEASILVHEEALDIQQKLVKENPQRFEPELARSYTNLANAYYSHSHITEAIDAATAALAIRKKLARENPRRYNPVLALTLNNLGVFYKMVNQYDQAVDVFEEALPIVRRLADGNRQAYINRVANILDNLAGAYRKLAQYESAAQAYEEAMEIIEQLAPKDIERYRHVQARIFNNMGLLHQDQRRYSEAILSFKQAVGLYQQLAKEFPQDFDPYLAGVYVNMGGIYLEWLLAEPTTQIQSAGLLYVDSANTVLSRCPNNSSIQAYKESHDAQVRFFQEADLRELGLIISAHPFRDSLSKAKKLSSKISLEQQIVNIYESALSQYPEAPHLKDSLVIALDSLATWQLFSQDYSGVESSVNRSKNIKRDYHSIFRWLAPTYLLQGKYAKANKFYQKWQNRDWEEEDQKTFRSIFLADLASLEKKGIYHEDFKKIKAMLQDGISD